ncbi:MAG TPA: hypothetical protein VF026_15295 [Ktedonobacteraceae bacterium]
MIRFAIWIRSFQLPDRASGQARQRGLPFTNRLLSFLPCTGQFGFRPVRLTTKRADRLVRLWVAVRLIRLVRMERAGPLFDLLSGFRFRYAIAFLDLASQHFDITFDLLYVVVREFAPLVAHAPAQLLPVALDYVV